MKMKSTYKIAGVVILFNPPNDVTRNINSYITQIDLLYLIDNSNTTNQNLLEEIEDRNKVMYHSFGENLGVAKALNYSAELAIKGGYDFLLTMDQDSLAPENLVEELIHRAEVNYNLSNVGIITPLHVNKFGDEKCSFNSLEELNCAKTSGNLLNLKVFRKIGLFKTNYFIDYVDIEFGFRLKLNGYKVLRINTLKLQHNEADISRKNLLYRYIYPYNNSPLRMYYKTRNFLYLHKEYKKTLPDEIKAEKSTYVKNLFKIIFENDRWLKVKYCIQGLFDYLQNKNGKYNN